MDLATGEQALTPSAAPHPAVVVFSPLPPERNGIADYTAELLAALSRHLKLTVVVDDDARPTPISGVEVLTLSAYRADLARWSALPHLYQLGNNKGHVYMLPELIRTPGVVTLHDTSLHHLVDQATLRYGDMPAYVDWLAAEHGEAGRVLGSQFQQRGWRGDFPFREAPMTRRLLESAPCVIVHSRFAALKTRAQAPQVPVRVIPHHVAPAAQRAASERERGALRHSLGVHPDDVLVVSLGFVTHSKQLNRVLDWLAHRRDDKRRIRYVVVGAANREEFDVESVARSLGISERVSLTGYVNEQQFFDWVIASDIVVNLRYPSGGETSGVFIRAMGTGACVVVNDIGPFAEVPDHCCVKVPAVGPWAETSFRQRLDELVHDADLRLQVGAAAASHMARTHSLDASARAYADVLLRYRRGHARVSDSRAQLPLARLHSRLADTCGSMGAALPLWLHDGMLPAATDESDTLLVVGPPGNAWLDSAGEIFGYAGAGCSRWASLATLPRAGRSFSSALVDLASTGTPRDADNAWLRLRSRLRPGGSLVIGGVWPESAARLAAVLGRSGFADIQVRHAPDGPTPKGFHGAEPGCVLRARACHWPARGAARAAHPRQGRGR